MGLKPKNNLIEIELVDNTEINTALNTKDVFIKGYSQRSKLMVANQGVYKNQRVWFYNYGVYIIEGKCFIHKDNIILSDYANVNGSTYPVLSETLPWIGIERRGYLCQAEPITQKQGIFDIRTQNWFVVKRKHHLSDNNICVNDIVVIVPDTSYKLIIDGVLYYWVEPQNIMLYISYRKNHIQPGPDFYLLKKIKNNNLFSGYHKGRGIGLYGKELLFPENKVIAEITLTDGDYMIVPEKEVYGKL